MIIMIEIGDDYGEALKQIAAMNDMKPEELAKSMLMAMITAEAKNIGLV